MIGWGPLLTAEWRKVASTKMAWVLLLVAVAMSAVNVVPLVLTASGTIPGAALGTDLLQDPAFISTTLAQAGTAAMFALILGVIAMTGEYRHMTITSTFLAEPRRGRVIVAKMALFAVFGAAMAVIVVVAVTLVVVVTLIPFSHAPVTADAVGRVLLGAVVGLMLYSVLGVSIGALLRSQVGAIITVVLWVLLLEPIAGALLPSAQKWLPGGALNSAMEVGLRAELTGSLTAADTLPVWAAIALLLAYAAAFALLASRTTIRRDIT